MVCEQEFSQTWGLYRKIENNKIFHLDYSQQKVMIKIPPPKKKKSFVTFEPQ